MECPVCGKENNSALCPECGFDTSRDYERHPTLSPVGDVPAVSALRSGWQSREPEQKPEKKRPWLTVLACAAMLVLGIGIGAVTGGGNPAPTEPSGNIQAQQPDPPATGSGEDHSSTEPSGNIQAQQPDSLTAGSGEELWEANVLRSDEVPEGTPPSGYPVLGSEYRREQILSVTFVDTLAEAPADAWDVSEAGDGRVRAWVIPNGALYDLYIGGEGGVSAGASCSDLFCEYINVEQFRFANAFHTENVQDMSHMFYCCESLTSLDLSSFVTANVRNMSEMFCSCESLTSLDLSDFDTTNVQDMSGMFSCCNALTSLDLSSFNTANVRDMGRMFVDCESLTSLDLSSFDTADVRDMCWMFDRCESLTSLDLSSFDTAKVRDMSGMFYKCYSLTSLDQSGFNTAYVQYMGYMFYGCTSLTSLDLSGFDTANVQDMGYMFYGCTSLTSLDLSSFDTTKVQDMTEMFYCCPAGDDWQHLLK